MIEKNLRILPYAIKSAIALPSAHVNLENKLVGNVLYRKIYSESFCFQSSSCLFESFVSTAELIDSNNGTDIVIILKTD